MNNKLFQKITGVLWVGWMIVIFLFSSQPAAESTEISGTICYQIAEKTAQVLQQNPSQKELVYHAELLQYPIRKAAHMTEYAILGLLSYLVLGTFWERSGKKYWLALGFAAFYAMTDEFHQLFVPGRDGQIKDVLIDTTGAAIALIFLFIIGKRRKKGE